ncbi:MAG: GyrI-like domain-containing protein [Gemmatimonadota bacterium]
MNSRSYEVVVVEAAARSVAGVRADVPFGRVAEYFARCLDLVFAAGRSGAIALDGQNIFIYHPGAPGVLVVDFCVGTSGPFAAIGEVSWRQTPLGTAATTFHLGDYGGLRGAHDAVHQWCRERGRTLAGPSWEVYGHWHADPAKLRTDVYYLLENRPTG